MKYFSHLINKEVNVSTIPGSAKTIECFRIAYITLPMGEQFEIVDSLYSRKSQRKLLSFKDIRINGYHIDTMNEGNI